MDTTIDTRDFFDREEVADLLVCVRLRQIKCHKIIFSSKSEHFAKLIRESRSSRVRAIRRTNGEAFY